MSKRFQRSRKKGERLPDGVVCVTRPGKWGNPYNLASEFRLVLESIDQGKFSPAELERPILFHMKRILDDIEELRGKDLACFCPLDKPCHAEVLIEFANSPKS